MRLYTFRLPPDLIERIDDLADRDRKRRADLVREALLRYVEERTAPIPPDEAEHALEVLRRVIVARHRP